MLVLLAQDAGVQELLGEFDAIAAKHEGMAAEEFNNDTVYKAGVIQVKGQRAAALKRGSCDIWTRSYSHHLARFILSLFFTRLSLAHIYT